MYHRHHMLLIHNQVLDLGENHKLQPAYFGCLPVLMELRLHCNALTKIEHASELACLTSLQVGEMEGEREGKREGWMDRWMDGRMKDIGQ